MWVDGGKTVMEEKRQIYIILTDTGTWFTRLIRLYTKATYNHASIAFDPECREVYSFGRKSPRNPFVGGFVKEDFRGELFEEATCAVYSCTVSERRYHHIQSIVRRIESDAQQYKYNLLGLFALMLNVRLERKRAYFCSQFVASLFEQTGTSLTAKRSEFATPADLVQSEGLKETFRGKLRALAV